MAEKVYDEKQQEVIRFNSGHALVLGAPGCGKTDILSLRVLMSHQIFRVDYKDMLCLTFTNRASREMKERIKATVPDITADLFIGNLHRFCIGFIYDNNLVPIDVSIADDTEQEEIFAELTGQVQVPGWKIMKVTDVAAHKFMKENYFPFEITGNDSYVDSETKYLAEKYIEYKKENKLIDFDDILLITYKALMEEGYQQKYMHSSYKWIQVDEMQDLNPIQLAIIEKLVSPDYNSVVYLGDERQAIYSFLGAKRESIEKIKEKAGSNFFVLSNNYRSPMYLLDMLNNYAIYKLKVDASLLPKTNNKEHLDDGLMLINCSSTSEQHNVIATLGRNLYLNAKENSDRTGNDKDLDSIGILVRTNKDAEEISKNLENHKIGHIKLSKKDVFKMVDFKTLYSHLSVVVNDTRFADWARLLYQTNALETLQLSKRCIKKMRDIGLTPLDLMCYENSSYYIEFCKSYNNKEVVLFDTETTGLDVFNDDIIQIAAMKMRNGSIVHGSELDIIIKMAGSKSIPPTLHDGFVNPMVEEYKRRSSGEQKQNQYFMEPEEAFDFFVKYIGDAELLGHNVNYDIHILENNIKRRAKCVNFKTPVYWDTLKMARMLDPNLRKHTLESLLETYGLEGINSHNALDDIRATKSLTDYCFEKMSNLVDTQLAFISHPELKKVQRRLMRKYWPLYQHTHDKLYSDIISEENSFDYEFDYIYQQMISLKIIKEIKLYPYIRSLFNKVVIDPEKDKYFNNQLVDHLYEFRTFNEGDFFQNGVLDERVFIMTIHKTKGLEFDDVILYDITNGRMPRYNTRNPDEDARVLYVAMSRAKKRLFMTYENKISEFLGNYDQVMEHFVDMHSEKKARLLNLENILVNSSKTND